LAKAGLLSALAHRPPLLLLDEPSSGLDVLVRRKILTAIIRTVADEGRTVLFSSHLLEEVERVADRVAMIQNGRLVLCASMEEIKNSHHRFVVRFKEGAPVSMGLLNGHLLTQRVSGNLHDLLFRGNKAEAREHLTNAGAEVVDISSPSLEDLFIAYAREGVMKGAGLCENHS